MGIKKQISQIGKISPIRLVLLSAAILSTVILISFELAYWQKIFPGINIAQIQLGNKTQQEAQNQIEKIIIQRKPKTLNFFWDAQSEEMRLSDEINLEELRLDYQPAKTIRSAYNFGRNQNPINNLKDRYRAWTKGKNFNLDYSLNQTLLEEKIATLSSQIFVPAIPPLILLDKQTGKIIIESGKEGQELETGKILNSIDFQLSNLLDTPISLPINKTTFEVSQETLGKTKTRAERLIAKRLKLQTTNQVFEIKGEELLPFVSFTNTDSFDDEKIKGYVGQLATLINQSAQDALFRFENGRVVAFQPSKKGALIDQTKTLQLIKEGLKALENLEEEEKIIKLPIQLIKPKIEIGDINRFGIVEKIGESHSSFRGSISSRIHNIQLASTKLSGILIPPGGVFSFNQSLGEVSETTSFKQAYIIKEGRTILGDGGGVCQASTTLFRAILNTGLPILERHPHAYRVVYYEQDSQPGFDATVFDPTADLKFKNDTPAYILVQPTVNTKNQTLVFEIYGTNDGRMVSISKARIWDQVPPPPDLYQDDPTLPAGTVKQIDWKAWGAKVAFDWKVTRNNEVLQERTFYSHYRPWQAVYLRGTGGLTQ